MTNFSASSIWISLTVFYMVARLPDGKEDHDIHLL